MRPASILDRSRMSLIKASRCRAAPSTRSSGSRSCFAASASSRSISLTPMMALSGVRSSWLILARNCDLCWLGLGELAALFLNFIKQPHVLDGNHRLIGEGGRDFDVLVDERPYGVPAPTDS